MVTRAGYYILEHVWSHRPRRSLADAAIGNPESTAHVRKMRTALVYLHEVSGVFPGVLSQVFVDGA